MVIAITLLFYNFSSVNKRFMYLLDCNVSYCSVIRNSFFLYIHQLLNKIPCSLIKGIIFFRIIIIYSLGIFS